MSSLLNPEKSRGTRSCPNQKRLCRQSCVYNYLDFTSEAEAHPHACRETQAKPSKTALRKAAKASRREKKDQNRAPSSGGDVDEPLSPPHTAPLTDSETGKSVPVSKGPSTIEPSEPLPLTANANPSRAEASTSPQNGHSTKPSKGAPRPTPPREPQSPPSVPRRAQPTAADQPLSQDLPSSSSSTKQAPPSGPVPRSSNNVKGPATSRPKTDTEAEKATKKGHNVLVRTLWTFIMLGGFLGQREHLIQGNS